MPREGENTYKRKDGRWEGRYIKTRTETGKALYGYLYAHTYREVKQKLILSIQTTENIIHISAEKNNSKTKILFGGLADSWMETIKPQIKESTYVKYSNVLKNYILPQFSQTEVSQMTYTLIEAYASQLLISGGIKKGGLSTKTVTDVIAIIREILLYG